VSPEDMDLFVLTDDVDFVMQHILAHCAECAASAQAMPTLPE